MSDVRVHHLNCGTMTPLIAGRIVAHVLLVESDDGLVLVDTGFGLKDCADHGRVGPARFLLKAKFREDETAAQQVEAMGFARSDVRHIAITHFDLDHVGGLADFPDATVHTTALEYATASDPPSFAEKRRYRKAQWSHGPKVHGYSGGEPWEGFDLAHPMTGVEGIALVPMPGHTRGHSCVAVDAGDRGWLLHAGDAVFDRGSIALPSDTSDDRAMRRTIRTFEQAVAQNRSKIGANHRRLTEIRAAGTHTVIPAHDPVVFDRLAAQR